MALTDFSYFIREINIGQLSQIYVHENLSYFIKKYENDFLINVFGFNMAQQVIAANNDLVNSSQAMRNLIEGNGVWIGLVNDAKISPIANYIYVKYTESELMQSVGTGVVIPKNENSTVVNPIYKLVWAWNEMLEIISQMHQFILSNKEDYPDYKWIGYSELCFNEDCECGCGGGYVFKTRNSLGL